MVIFLFFLIVPFVCSQTLTVEDLFNSRALSYSSSKVMVPEDGVFKIEENSITYPADESSTTFYYVGEGLIASASQSGIEYSPRGRLGTDIKSKSLPFGQPINIENRFSFTGKEFDNELYYFGARYYNPNLGRFISVDPITNNHPYIYADNDPINFVDPDGREELRYTWGAPEPDPERMPVVFYNGEGQFAGGPFSPMGNFDAAEATFSIPDPLLATGFGFRVRGVGINDENEEVSGPWSDTSAVYYGGSVSGVDSDVGDDFAKYGGLPPSYPNPASDRSKIRYYVPIGGVSEAKLNIYNIKGELMKDIEVDVMGPGYQEYEWDLRDRYGRDVASGVYIIHYTFRFEFTGHITDGDGKEVASRYFTNPIYTQKMTVIE
jgi:RHS repeat-associated protein